MSNKLIKNYDTLEEILFTFYCSGWNKNMKVKLIHYQTKRSFPTGKFKKSKLVPDGTMDLHLQTGQSFHDALEFAKKLLAKRGLIVKDEHSVVGMSGVYFSVEKIKSLKDQILESPIKKKIKI